MYIYIYIFFIILYLFDTDLFDMKFIYPRRENIWTLKKAVIILSNIFKDFIIFLKYINVSFSF